MDREIDFRTSPLVGMTADGVTAAVQANFGVRITNPLCLATSGSSTNINVRRYFQSLVIQSLNTLLAAQLTADSIEVSIRASQSAAQWEGRFGLRLESVSVSNLARIQLQARAYFEDGMREDSFSLETESE